MENSKYAKIIWTINGTILLLVFVIAIILAIVLIVDKINSESYEYNKGVVIDETSEKAKKIGIDLQHLFYDHPQRVSSTNYYYSAVYVIDKEIPKDAFNALKKANDISMDLFGGTINILFFNIKTNEAYSLLNDFGFITNFDIPLYYKNSDVPEAERRGWILYKISRNDTNGDGRINREDKSNYYMSDLSGKNLIQITPENIQLDNYWIDDKEGLIYFEKIERLSDKDEFGFLLKRRTIYIYDVALKKFYKFSKLQSAFDSLQSAFKNQ